MANTRFSDIVLDDPALSMSAKGIFVSIGFFGNGCRLADLEAHTRDSTESLRSSVQELVQAGYLNVEGDEQLFIRTAASFGILG